MTEYTRGFNDGLIVGISQKGFVKETIEEKNIIFGKIEGEFPEYMELNGAIINDCVVTYSEITEVE